MSDHEERRHTQRRKRSTVADVDGKVEELAGAVHELLRAQDADSRTKRRALWENRGIAALLAIIWALLLAVVNDGRLQIRWLSETIVSHLERIVKVEQAVEYMVPAVSSPQGRERAAEAGVLPPDDIPAPIERERQ